MDIRVYYQKIRQAASEIGAEHVIVVSLETADGGKGNVRTEVSRAQAARLLVEGKARLASEAEAAEHRAEQEERRLLAEAEAEGRKVQVTVVSEPDRKVLKGASKAVRP